MTRLLVEDFRYLVNFINEGDDNSSDDKEQILDFSDIKKALTSIAELSPTAKLHIIKLTSLLSQGIKNKPIDGGKKQFISKIISILDIAESEGRDDALREIFELVSTTEGDSNAVDEKIFPQVIVVLILIAGEIAQQTK
jgi:hypothetical protein